MKFKVKITQEVIDKTKMCGIDDSIDVTENCLFAYCFNQLVPRVRVCESFEKKCTMVAVFYGKSQMQEMAEVELDNEIFQAIRRFDNFPTERQEFLNKEYELEIPENVIIFWHGDTVAAVQKLIDNPILQPLT